jgi:hypothetical protein
MQEPAAICDICGESIFVDVDDEATVGTPRALRGLHRRLERAATEHLATHPLAVVQHFLLRKHLDELAPTDRLPAVKQVYSELRELWGDTDARGVYGVDEALGSAAMYRLWMDADRCGLAACRHRAE